MEVGKRLIDLRKKYSITRSALSKKSGVALSFLNSIERGEKEPTIHTLNRICSALGLSLSEFFTDEDKMAIQIPDKNKSLVKEPGQLPPNLLQTVNKLKKLTSRQIEVLNVVLDEWIEPKGE